MLQINHLTIRHARDLRPLLEDFSFTLNAGDRAAIIGEEGNGKSTLIKLIADPSLVEGYAEYSGEIATGGARVGGNGLRGDGSGDGIELVAHVVLRKQSRRHHSERSEKELSECMFHVVDYWLDWDYFSKHVDEETSKRVDKLGRAVSPIVAPSPGQHPGDK